MLERLKNNLVLMTLRRAEKLLTKEEKRRGIKMVIVSLISIVIDVAGLAMLIPLMMAATDKQFVLDNSKMNWLLVNFAGGDYGLLLVLLAVSVLLIFLSKNSFTLLVGSWQSRFIWDVATNLARRQYMKYYNRGFTYFKVTSSSEIVNNIVNIPVFFASGVLTSVINFLTEFSVLTFIVISIAIFDPTLFLALILVLAPSGFLIYGGTKNRLYVLGRTQQRLGAENYARIQQAIFGFVDVRLTNRENVFLENYQEGQKQLNNTFRQKYLISLIPSRGLEVIAVLGIVVIFGYSYFISNSTDGIFEFVAIFAAAAFRVLPSMNRSLAALMGMKNQIPSLDELERGNLPVEMDSTKVAPMDFNSTIEFRNLGFKFDDGEGYALKNINLSVKKGEKIGLIGESGSGKTTLMNILLRFLLESEGGIYVDDKKLETSDVASWRAKIGYVQQQVFLLDGTLSENVAFGEKASEVDEKQVWAALEQASMLEFVKSLPDGIHTPVGEMGSRLSGGQRQRIGIARALYYKSEVLVFDEATSALDTETENSITESINAIGEDKTVFVIAHRITTLKSCERIIELKDGKIDRIWNYQDLIQEKVLK